MSDLISRKALVEALRLDLLIKGELNYDEVKDLITNAPAIEQGDFGISVMKYTEFGIVPDDYKNQASGYRAGWNDCIASVKYVVTTPQQPQEQGELVRKAVADALEEAANIKVNYTKSGRDDALTKIVEDVIQEAVESAISKYKEAIRALIKRNAEGVQ